MWRLLAYITHSQEQVKLSAFQGSKSSFQETPPSVPTAQMKTPSVKTNLFALSLLLRLVFPAFLGGQSNGKIESPEVAAPETLPLTEDLIKTKDINSSKIRTRERGSLL